MKKFKSEPRTWRRSMVAMAAGMCLAGVVFAQSTTGSINGSAPAGTTVTVTSGSGVSRTVTADAQGRYNVSQLPIGDYTVEAKGIGSQKITVTVGSSANVSFTGTTTITVVGARIAKIDPSTIDTRTVLTAKDLERIPLVQSAQAIALLAPGANAGAGGFFGNLTSFGGAGVSENAYYINGFFSGEPLSNLGQLELPYGAIAQQETYTGGYSAKFGRSAGGVINQIGKSGSNEFTFGGKVTLTPKSLRSDPEDIYYPNLSLPTGYTYESDTLPGTLFKRESGDKRWAQSYSVYAGGPLIKDRLFGFLALSQSTTKRVINPENGVAYSVHSEVKDPKVYAKLNWNITDNHLLEYTYLSERYDLVRNRYAHDFATGVDGAKLATVSTPEERDSTYNILAYTGYLTPDLTLSVNYGRGRYTNKQVNPGILPGIPLISSANLQNPALNGGVTIPNRQGDYLARDGKDDSDGLRAELEWRVASHTLTAGIDNIKFEAKNEGQAQVADRWIYGRLASPTGNINASLGVGNPYNASNPNGYHVQAFRFSTATSMTLEQKAWFLEDRWQVTRDVLLSLGLRNDRFTNRNNTGEAYMDAKDQWAPRVGGAWDVFSDSSFKVFGNAGRYFLALPNNVAIRGASSSTFTREYFTYTGIDANGAPTGLTPVPGVGGAPAPGAVSSNGELGQPVDVLAFAPKDLENMYQDEFILGFEKAFAKGWNFGAKFTRRDLKSSVDDVCDPYSMMDAMGATSYTFNAPTGSYYATLPSGQQVDVKYCYMFNPGGSNTYSFANVGAPGRTEFKLSATELGFKEDLKRTYNAIDLFVERPFDGVWSLRVDYTYSKLRGNNEGQVKSEFGQNNISKTQDWDAWQLMQYANGYLINDRRHQLKIRGSYLVAPEWTVSGNVRVMSGTPVGCLGLFNPDGSIDENSSDVDPIGYGASYHTCFGKTAVPGEIRTPWTHQVDLGLTYRPNFLKGKLAVSANVFNVINQRKAQQLEVTSETGGYTVNNEYLLPLSNQAPRSWQFSVSYDY